MGLGSTIGSVFCRIRLLLLIAVCIMVVGWAGLYLRDSQYYGLKYRQTADNFWKCSPPERKLEDKTPPSIVEETTKQEQEEKVCPALSPYLKGTIPLFFDPTLTLEKVRKKYPKVDSGRFQPEGCRAQQRVAILIPHRNREKHLLYLLDNLHPFLQRQQLDYGIYVIHQAGDAKFNRAKLLNVGYLEALKEENWDCFILHDVDLVPENDFNTYLCDTEPKHLVVGRNVTGYKCTMAWKNENLQTTRLWYKGYFGGVTAMSRNQFAKVNGYSNNYWGWGGEDDDLRLRVNYGKMTVVRPPAEIARYTMVFHTRDSGNEINNRRMKLLKEVSKVWKTDGLNSCNYKLLSVFHEPLYINITVDVGRPQY